MFSIHFYFFAVEGVNADFIVQDTLHLLLYGPNPSPFDVPITVRVDGIALEPAERFTLSLDPINPTATFILAGRYGLFVFPEISVVIRNLESKKYLRGSNNCKIVNFLMCSQN